MDPDMTTPGLLMVGKMEGMGGGNRQNKHCHICGTYGIGLSKLEQLIRIA